MAGEHNRLRSADNEDPIWRLWRALPQPWRGPIIGPGIEDWNAISENKAQPLNLAGLPAVMAAEIAWMAYWQATDGTRASVLALSQLANMIRHAIAHRHPLPDSIRAMDWADVCALQGWFYASRWKRLVEPTARRRLRIVFRFAHLALRAACHEGVWWELDDWYPRCDPRIPLSKREPLANYGCSPGAIVHPWLREAAKWYLGTMLEAGTLRWTTISQERLNCLRRFDNWLSATFDDPLQVLADPVAAPGQAASFARWAADSHNRRLREEDRRHLGKPVHPRLVNDDLRAVAELFGFIADNPAGTRAVLGPSSWRQVTPAHAASWFRQVKRLPRERDLNDDHYIDDHALAQITAALPLIGTDHDQQLVVHRGDGQHVTVTGLGDPQAERMILLQILTGRRHSEIRTCEFDCLSAVPDRVVDAAEGEQVARFHYAQSKIDAAPDTILVGADVTQVIAEQQDWVRQQFPGLTPRFLFLQRTGNRSAIKAYPSGTYTWVLRQFSDTVQISDSKGRPVRLSHTHRFRHTKLTRLAELGLPIHVLQRYAGHATPTMSMHYIAQRQEHAEQAFLATVKLRADGTRVQFSREDHDSLHLFDRADRFLPHGWCLLPPMQTCDKGNACLTCSVFVTDATHQATLQRQLADTEQLITRTINEFHQRHGRPMPEDNVWLVQRRAEHTALTQVLAAMGEHPGRAVQGAGCGSTPAGPVMVALTTSPRRIRP
jgi:hypothetical protein